MKNAFPYPLPLHALQEFCHPYEYHQLAKPVMIAGQVYACNGYIALRAYRGAWLDSDFQLADESQFARLNSLPWALFDHITTRPDWRLADEQRGIIFKRGRIGVWFPSGALNACPIWRVNEIPVRLSLLQLAAMLPRCEFYTGKQYDRPVAFRFSGGVGFIASHRDHQARIARSIFNPRRCPLDGTRLS